jgi:hypothetical protein
MKASIKPVKLGKPTIIRLANGETRKAQYALFDLKDVLASHDEQTFASSLGFPTDIQGRNVNDRNYGTDKIAQGQVIDYANNLQADRLLTNSKTPNFRAKLINSIRKRFA